MCRGTHKIIWTPEMDSFLINYPDLTAIEIAEELNIGKSSVSRRKKVLGVKSTRQKITESLKDGEDYCDTCLNVYKIEELVKNASEKKGYARKCRHCESIYAKERRRAKLRESVEEEIPQKDLETDIIFKCDSCNAEKKGSDYNYIRGKRRNRCRLCTNKKNEENRIERIKNGKGWC